MSAPTQPRRPSSPVTRENERAKYSEAYGSTRYGAKPKQAKRVRSPELEKIEPNSTYLDVSCGRGEALKQVLSLQRNVTVRGTELVPALCNEFVQNAELPELEGVEPADFVSCYEVLEHLPTHSVLPAIDRLFEISRKMLILSTNDMPSRSKVIEHDDPLHLSRFPQRWWLNQLELRCMKRNARLHFRHLRERHVERPDGPRRFWVFYVDFREPYQPYDFGRCDFYGYDSEMADLWFWHAPLFPVAEIGREKRSSPEVLNHPAVRALWRDLDKSGLHSPILLHNIPGQPNRRYWVRCGNHRAEWAMTRGLKTVNAIVYGGCEYEPCTPMTLRDANRLIKDGKLSFASSQPPNVVDVKDWHYENGPWKWDAT